MEKITEFKVLSDENMGSGHLPVFVSFTSSPLTRMSIIKKNNNNELIFKYEKADWENLRNELDILEPNQPPTDDINALNTFFVESIIYSARKSISLKSNSINVNYRKKFPKNIVEILNIRKGVKKELDRLKKHNIFDKALKRSYNDLTTEFKLLKSKFENEIMQNLIDRVGPNPTSSREFWSRINCFRKPAGSKLSTSLLSNNVELVEPKEKADLHAKRLESIYSSSNIDPNFNREFFNSVETLIL